jgi:hypothetical protein
MNGESVDRTLKDKLKYCETVSEMKRRVGIMMIEPMLNFAGRLIERGKYL